ncbi:MAG TPA: GIY-YIG nuclease family protein, partial [Longimicrobium sp.]|nr:GIY-YIG nuclease family protein [Longimicrobium sp.]
MRGTLGADRRIWLPGGRMLALAPNPASVRMHHNYYVYILASRKRVLYVGVTNDLVRRVGEHKQGVLPGFTWRYNVDRLVYYEQMHDVSAAIAREKEIKGWVRDRKLALVESQNPEWRDLYIDIAPGASPDVAPPIVLR